MRANYNDLKNGIHETTTYLELFLRNLLLNEQNPLLHDMAAHGIIVSVSGQGKGKYRFFK